jgi:hypothetical protein
MWWKLIALCFVTSALVLSVLPIRTRSVDYDVFNEAPPAPPSIVNLLKSMYLTPGTVLAILAIVAVASFVAIKVVRGRW